MRYSILGTTQAVRSDGAAVAVGGPRLRALLTVLALRAGRTVPVGQLVAEVWDGDEPADATAALQALVGRLRRSLGRAAVESVDGGGYRLAAAPDDVDAHRFERLAGEGARALADGAPVEAAALLDEALGLWRGPALADLPDRTADAARLDARHLDARRARLAAALGLGRAEQILPELTALCAEHPLDEPLQALRLRALRDAGRAAEALAAYEAVRAGLAEQLGTDPGAELRALHGELLAGSPDPARTDSHRGSRPPGPPAPGNLRTRLTSFVGREADIEALRGDLGRARLVTLLGPGGAGKTRLSQEAAETLPVPDGVWLAELAPVAAAAAATDPAAVPEAVLTALGGRRTVLYGMGAEELRAATDQAGGDPLVRLAEHCAPRRMVLLLDNCEHVVESAARTVEYLLAHCPQLTVLATSREPLGVPGELVRPLEPLPEPVALRLLADRGAAARPGFRIEDDPEACAEICRRLDGLPLAVELAAARLRSLTPRQIADRLDDRFRLLTSGSRTVLPRQQTLRAVVDWSWELLDARERAVLQRLSVFAGGCELDAAEAVCGGAPTGPGQLGGEPACALDLHVDRRDVTDLMGSLVDKSLVVAAPSGLGTMRYRLLETVAEYAGAHLDEARDRPAAEHAHLVHYRELARRADPELRTARQKQAIARIESEYENLRTALRRAADAGDEQEALCLVLSLCWYWQMRDLRSESRHWSAVVSALGPDPFAEPVEQAPPLAERCTAKPPPMEPEQLQEARRGAHLLGLASMDHRGDEWTLPKNGRRLRAIVAAYRPGLPQTCWSPGAFWVFAVLLTGRPDDLRELLDRNVRTCRAHGYRWELASTLQLRANVLANRSAWGGDAERDATEALALFTELGDSWGAAEALSARGEAWERRGELAHAEEDFAAAIEHAEAIGAAAQVSVLQVRLAGIMLETGRPEQGEAMLWKILEEAGDTFSEAVPAARIHLAGRLGASGRRGEAREQLDLLWDQYFSGPAVMFKGVLHGIYGWLDILDGRHEEAYEHAAAAFRWSQDPVALMIAPHMASVQLALAAWSLAGREKREPAYRAARLLGAADALRPAGHRPASQERVQRDTAEQAVREILGDEAYERGHAEGGGLTLEEAAALL
ncbi:BTAD domain-containing putative transcriptional regulator [Streptomyces luteolus]|uniref:BTAD domain-containing putative transcriptional regulator n=1 Tax=Streptomyces luteolus TaxID=3043615 RepID=A0ABT6T9A2_9ACTN|nr:BTAD domain-containing putative transcriptional regulator [Streptomyces sp. B-S-A12]MDI3424201.1 BTAD domain-containing putative transcriptional regulator [Streptomyces sp. B-S-A12]